MAFQPDLQAKAAHKNMIEKLQQDQSKLPCTHLETIILLPIQVTKNGLN